MTFVSIWLHLLSGQKISRAPRTKGDRSVVSRTRPLCNQYGNRQRVRGRPSDACLSKGQFQTVCLPANVATDSYLSCRCCPTRTNDETAKRVHCSVLTSTRTLPCWAELRFKSSRLKLVRHGSAGLEEAGVDSREHEHRQVVNRRLR